MTLPHSPLEVIQWASASGHRWRGHGDEVSRPDWIGERRRPLHCVSEQSGAGL